MKENLRITCQSEKNIKPSIFEADLAPFRRKPKKHFYVWARDQLICSNKIDEDTRRLLISEHNQCRTGQDFRDYCLKHQEILRKIDYRLPTLTMKYASVRERNDNFRARYPYSQDFNF